MTTRRKLKDAIASNEELNFVFGQGATQKITQVAEATQEQLIPCHDILCTFTFVPDGKPVRHYYDPEELQQWALNDIKPNGIRSPLWVRPHPDQAGKYELVAGLRRFKAAGIIQLETVPSKVFNWDDRTAFHAAISENANRRDFSALEELDNMLRLLEIQLGCDVEAVVSLLYRMNNAAKGTTNQNVLVSPEAELVKKTFNEFGKITWQSFVSSRLPMLKKPDDILDAIRRGEIHYTKGILVAGLKDDLQRQQLLRSVQSDFLSVAEIKRQVSQLNQMIADPTRSKRSKVRFSQQQFQSRLTSTLETAEKNPSLWSDDERLEKLEKLLKQLESIVKI